MNAKFGKLVDQRIEYAPSSIETDGEIKINPSEESYLSSGWKRVVDEMPTPQPGNRIEFSRWEESETAITAVYKEVRGPGAKNGVRVFSKLKVVAALKETDKWVLVKTWIEEKGYYDYYLAAQDFAEDNELFVAALAAIKAYARFTDEEVEALLSRCVID